MPQPTPTPASSKRDIPLNELMQAQARALHRYRDEGEPDQDAIEAVLDILRVVRDFVGPEAAQIAPVMDDLLAIRRVAVYVTDSDGPDDGAVYLTATLADGTRKRVELGSVIALDTEVSAYELRTGRTV